MGALQDALNSVIVGAFDEYVAEAVVKRLATAGVILTTDQRRSLAEQLQGHEDVGLNLEGWPQETVRDIDIALMKMDANEVCDDFATFLNDHLPALLISVGQDISRDLLSTLHRTWPQEAQIQAQERRGFEQRLHERWGSAIGLLQMALTVSRECGQMVVDTAHGDPDFASPHLLDALARLHARACQVMDEVIRLLGGGFADGAMARWRTLHEIAAVAFFLQQHGEPTAQRYVAHQAVESYRAACDYRRCSVQLGYEPMSDAEFKRAERAYQDALRVYGGVFAEQYGWAAEALEAKRPTIRRIERAANVGHMRAHYRLASHNVHANPKGAYFKLGLPAGARVLLTGPSNTGLADPGHCAAISLLQVTTALGQLSPSLDSMIALQVLVLLTSEVGEAFADASTRSYAGDGETDDQSAQ